MSNTPVPLRLKASSKTILAGYAFAVLMALGISFYIATDDAPDARLWWLLAIPGAIALYAMAHHLQLSFTHLTIEGGRIRYESGMFSKTTRTMDLSKLQDVRVDQSVGQRLLGIGDLSIESAGNTSQIVILGIDRPQEAADCILELARAR